LSGPCEHRLYLRSTPEIVARCALPGRRRAYLWTDNPQRGRRTTPFV